MTMDQFAAATPKHFELSSGQMFRLAPPAQVVDFLRSRETESVDDNASSFRVSMHGRRFILEHVNGAVQQWPMRHAFFQKLLRWYHVPRKPLYRMEADALLPFLNGILRLINKSVTVRIEDGEALTITSPLFADVRDLDVLDRFTQPIEKITRTDFLMRAYTLLRVQAEAIPGDLCGFGANIFNSETGFLALEVTVYVHRYVCSNGATVALPRTRAGGLVHYDVSPDACERYLSAAMTDLNETIPALIAKIQAACTRRLPDERAVVARLNQIVDFPHGKTLYGSFQSKASATFYGLFNFLTNKAKSYPPERQMQIEAYAGELLSS